MEAEAREVKVGKTKTKREKERGWKETRRKGVEEEKTKKCKNNRSEESSREMRSLGQRGGKGQEIGFSKIP